MLNGLKQNQADEKSKIEKLKEALEKKNKEIQ
jgi:hypothetical protein